ncbi:MAG: hypothetical protein R3C59_04185 [Planctomycetaceae bacterium]
MSISEQDIRAFEEYAIGQLRQGQPVPSVAQLARQWELQMQRSNGEVSATAEIVRSARDTLERYAKEQGVGPVNDASELFADFWPEDTDVDEFLEGIHQGRDRDHSRNPLND